MLDTLDDDAFDRGMTLASFDSRQVLDQCADLAARTLRLPVGHPNRRVSVLGRCDWGTGEAVRRVGRRYRAVMRSLLKQGVPIDRYQVLRGASLGWLNALTSASMSALLSEGHQNFLCIIWKNSVGDSMVTEFRNQDTDFLEPA